MKKLIILLCSILIICISAILVYFNLNLLKKEKYLSDDQIIKLSQLIKEKSKELKDERGMFFLDEAVFTFYDIDNDNIPELIFGTPNYKQYDIYVYKFTLDSIVQLDGVITSTMNSNQELTKLIFYFSKSKTIIKSIYIFESGVQVQECNTEYTSLENNKLKNVGTTRYVVSEDEIIEYSSSLLDNNKLTEKQFNMLESNIIGNYIRKDEVILDKYVGNYLEGNNLYNSIEKAYT